MRLREGRIPEELYVKQADKLRGIQEAQKAFNKHLENSVKSGNLEKVKKIIVTMVEETLLEPRTGSLESVSDTVDVLVDGYSNGIDVIKQLLNISSTDYSIVLHSINVMAYALAFASFNNYSQYEAKTLGLCALLHDVGKKKINQDILNAPRKLTNAEFTEVKSHTTMGYNILRECKFNEKEISICALEHHEKLDGSGYPNNKTAISRTAQIVGLIDSFETLTNEERIYRKKMKPFDVLNQIIKKDVKNGKFNAEIFSQFVKSLCAIKKI